MWLWVIWGLAALAALLLHFRHIYSKFSKRGVKSDKVIPPFGSMAGILLRREHLVDAINRSYFSFPEERFVGRFEFIKPLILVRDLELVKKITIKDFEHFEDHRVFLDEQSNPLFARNLFFLKGQEWKDMRSTLSPAFTSSKMKLMVPFMIDVGDQMVLSLKKSIKECNSQHLEVDVKDLTTRYACDVIATCAFGLKVDSHSDRTNEFYTQGLRAATFKFKQLVLFFLASAFPWLVAKLNTKLFAEESQNFFRNIVNSAMSEREKLNIHRPDMIHLLMEAKKGKLTHDEKVQDSDAGFATVEESNFGKKDVTDRVWSNDDLIAQAVLFFIAGFETVSSAMSFLLYELAVNPEVQDKLALEIREMDAKTGGKLDYNSIQQMPYLDMVISEVLRKWPPAIALDRVCVKDYNLGKPNDKATEDYIIHKGEGLQIPSWAIHHDPDYFPDPEKFDPERFSEENKNNIKPFSYSPFGLGPRNCIGSRFALSEVKIMAYQLLRYMELSPGPRTLIPVQLEKETFNIKIKGGHWLNIKVRA